MIRERNASACEDLRRRSHRANRSGDGKRKCPGRHLARVTMAIAIEELVAGLDGLRLDGEVEWDVENLPALSPKVVPIAWDPA